MSAEKPSGNLCGWFQGSAKIAIGHNPQRRRGRRRRPQGLGSKVRRSAENSEFSSYIIAGYRYLRSVEYFRFGVGHGRSNAFSGWKRTCYFYCCAPDDTSNFTASPNWALLIPEDSFYVLFFVGARDLADAAIDKHRHVGDSLWKIPPCCYCPWQSLILQHGKCPRMLSYLSGWYSTQAE